MTKIKCFTCGKLIEKPVKKFCNHYFCSKPCRVWWQNYFQSTKNQRSKSDEKSITQPTKNRKI